MTRYLGYFPGTAILAAGPRVAALTTDAGLAGRLWPLIAQGGSGSDVLQEAVRDGLTGLADLLLVEFNGSLTRVFARGPHTAEVLSSDGQVVACTGREASTWAERLFDDARSVTVNAAAGGDVLPIVTAMVRAGGFGWTKESDSGHQPPLPAELTGPNSAGAGGTAVPDFAVPGPAAPDIAVPVPAAPEPAAAGRPAPPIALSPLPKQVAAVEKPARPTLAETRTEPVEDAYDHLFGSTIYRSVEAAAVRDVVDNLEPLAGWGTNTASAASAVSEQELLGDHDGSTIMASQLAALQPVPEVAQERDDASVAGSAILELVTGERIDLNLGAVIGRRPQVDRVAGGAIPRLITVESPQQDISRSHLQITRYGDSYTATDLHSMNGTLITGVDGTKATLHGGQHQLLRIGDVLDLGDGVTATLLAAP